MGWKRKHIYPIRPSPEDVRDFNYIVKASRVVTNTQLPPIVDLRSHLPMIRNQGNEGACAAFSAACMKEYQERVSVGYSSFLSPWYVYLQREDPNEEGMYLRDVMKILHKKGICTEKQCKYKSIRSFTDISADAEKEAANFRIASYAQISTLQDLKRALYFHGPCLIAFPVYSNSTTFWRKSSPTQASDGGHAVAVVGYDDNRKAFLLRNSWGILWGNLGYTWYPYEDWGSHWEVWSSVDDRSEPISNDDTHPAMVCGCL
jgi:C1A family cysteine protease